MANNFRQPTQSDLDREQYLLGLASAQSKAYTQSQVKTKPSAPETDYTTAPDRVSLYELNQISKTPEQSPFISKTPLLDAWKAGLFRPDTDYTYTLDRVPFTHAITWAGGNAAETKATDLSSSGQSAPWLNTPQFGDDGTPLSGTAAQTGKTGYGGSSGRAGAFGPDMDYTTAPDRLPFTLVNQGIGIAAPATKTPDQPAPRQSAPWLNTPQYGDDGTPLSGLLAQTGKTGYDGTAGQDALYLPDRASFTSVNLPNLAEDIQAEYGRRLTRCLTDGVYQAQQELAALRGGTSAQFSDTRYLTAAERRVILAYADRGEYAAAMSYYNSLRDTLAQRTGRQIADSIGSMENPVLKDLVAVGLGLDDGLNRSVSGLMQAGGRLLGSDAPVAQSPSVYANQIIRPQLTGFAGAASDVASSVGFMLPGFAVGAATGLPALGSVMLGLTSAGDTYNRERRAGKDDMEAFFYAASIGALEGGLQYMLGGINALGKNGVSKLLAKSPAAQAAVTKVDGALRMLAQSETARELLAEAAKAGGFALRMNDQGLEEWLQANLEPVVRNAVFGEDNQFQPFSSDKLYSYMLGALTAGLYNLYYDNFSSQAKFEKDFEDGWAEGGYEDEVVTKGAGDFWESTDNLIKSATTPGKGGVSPVGRAFQKHAGNPSRAGTFVGEVSGNATRNTEQGAQYISDILSNPQSTYKVRHTDAFGDILDVRLPDGTGARWSADGKTFIGFLEKYTK